jgi:PAS domain S-box-containing protein
MDKKRFHIIDPASNSPAHTPDGFDRDRHFAAIVESSDDAIISKDLNGTIRSWNKGAERIFGYTPAEAIGKPVTMLMPPGKLDEEPNILGRIRRGERVDHYHTVRRHKNGSLVDISLTVSPIRDRAGTIVGASKIARDITDQKRANEIQRHFSAIVESSDDAIISKDLNGIIRSWNKGAERIFGYAPAEVIGKPILILMPEQRQNEESHILARIRNGERIDHYETIRRRKDGTLVNISLTVSPIRDDAGNVVGASKIARDITPQTQAEEALRKAQQELAKANSELEERVKARTSDLSEAIAQMQEFSYTVSHDLRGPVRAMHGYAEAIIEDFGENLEPQAREYLNRIVRGSERMDKLIHDVLIYSRLSQAQIKLEPVSLEALIDEITRQYPEMQRPQTDIRIKKPLMPVVGHESSLTQAVSNLFSNAKKFVTPGETPKIEVWTERRGGKVRLGIRDNGIGIKPEYQSRLFGMFERVNQDDQYEGTGVGLAIVKKAVEKMGGSVGVESDGREGSLFWIELPFAESSSTLAAS